MIARSRSIDLALVSVAGLAVRLWLIFVFPMIFGNDTMVRLVNHDKVLMSYQLPLLQVLIYLSSRLTSDPLFIRLLMAVIGAIAGAGFYLLAEDLSNRNAAVWAAILFTLNPFIAGFSTVPYQEILMLAGLLFAFHYYFRENWIAASLCLALACFTRFEAWVAAAVLIPAYILRDRRPSSALKACVLFGWSPLAWMLFRHGLSPAGSYVIDHSFSIWRLQRIAYIGWISVKHTPIPILLLACGGALVLVEQAAGSRTRARAAPEAGQPSHDRRLLTLGAFFLLFLIAVLFSAHGEPPDPERHVTMREAHIPIAAISLLTAFALKRTTRLVLALAAMGVVLCMIDGYRLVQAQTSRPDIQLGYQVARYLDGHTNTQERVMVLANPLRESDLRMYLDKVRQTGGEPALAEARKILAGMDSSPLDYQRILIHSRLGRERLRPFTDRTAAPDWIVAWNDFAPPDAQTAQWYQSALAHPAAVLRSGERSVWIRRLD